MSRPRLADLPDVLDPATVAEVTGLGENATYRALARGDLPGVKVGGRWLIGRDALARTLGVDVPDDGDGSG